METTNKPTTSLFDRRNAGKTVFRLALLFSVIALTIATLQILFDIPVAPFLVPHSQEQGALHTAQWSDGTQIAIGKIGANTYPSLVAQQGVPVEFTLTAESGVLNSCNEKLIFSEFGIEIQLVPGENVLAFTPTESGVFPFSCWMGTIKGSVTVVEDLGFPSDGTQPDSYASKIGSSVNIALPTPIQQSSEILAHPTSAQQSTESLAPTTGISSAPSSGINDEPVYEKPNGSDSLGGWLEGQLLPDESTAGSKEIRTWTGWLFDRDCVGISPVKHTKNCNLMGSCFDSGLGMFEYVPGKAFDGYTALDTFQTFDGASKELAVAFLNALPATCKNNVTIEVSGYAVNNIPASDDELLIPETDLSHVSHYLSGIHITEIKMAFIDGISTNLLPQPNIVFTQP
jgi:hypothetical protein